jgi:hypothetical protein
MKRLIAIVSILALALVLAPAALAGGGGNGGGNGAGGGNGGGVCDGTGTGVCDGTGTGTGVCDGTGTGTGTGTQTQPQVRGVKYSLNGVVQAADTDASTLSVLVKQSNRKARPYKGKTVTITITATTALYQRTVDGELVVITLADLKSGDRIQSIGTLIKTDPAAPIFTAQRVTLRPALGTSPTCPNN